MSYRNKTYVIFDGDNDMWAYAYMKGWKESEHIEFDFHDAHDLKPLTDRPTEETVRSAVARTILQLKTNNCPDWRTTIHLYKFVRWEIETALELNLAMIAESKRKTAT